MIKILGGIALTAAVLIALISASNNQTPVSDNTSTDNTIAGNMSYTTAEVALRNTPENCWLIISGEVYDVSTYVTRHPGGQVITSGCGRDATELFQTKAMSGKEHSASALSLLADFRIGTLSNP